MHFNIWCHAMYAGSGAASPGPFPRCVTVLSYQSPPLSKPPFFLLENDSKAKSYLAGQPRSQSCHSLLAMNLFPLRFASWVAWLPNLEACPRGRSQICK